VIGYEKPEFSVYLKGEQSWDRPTVDFNQWRLFFSSISLTGLYRRNARESYGMEVAADPHGNAITSITGLAEYQYSSRNRLKAKLNHRLLFQVLV